MGPLGIAFLSPQLPAFVCFGGENEVKEADTREVSLQGAPTRGAGSKENPSLCQLLSLPSGLGMFTLSAYPVNPRRPRV